MPNITVTVNVQQDGMSLPGFPLVRRVSAADLQVFDYSKAADNDETTFTALPAPAVGTISVLIVRAADKVLNLRLNGQSDARVPLSPGGVLLVIDTSMSGATVNNPDASAVAQVQGVEAGT